MSFKTIRFLVAFAALAGLAACASAPESADLNCAENPRGVSAKRSHSYSVHGPAPVIAKEACR